LQLNVSALLCFIAVVSVVVVFKMSQLKLKRGCSANVSHSTKRAVRTPVVSRFLKSSRNPPTGRFPKRHQCRSRSIVLAPSRIKNKSKSSSAASDRYIPQIPLGDEHASRKCPNLKPQHNNNPRYLRELCFEYYLRSGLEERDLVKESDGMPALTTKRLLEFGKQCGTAGGASTRNRMLKDDQDESLSWIRDFCRAVPEEPEKILDAPDILNDFYLNILDWSSRHCLAVALNNELFCCTLKSGNVVGQIKLLCQSYRYSDFITAVKFTPDGLSLVVAYDSNIVELWDVEQMQRIRRMEGFSARIAAMDWRDQLLTSGDKKGRILHHDMRCKGSTVTSVAAHKAQICGLTWSPSGCYLASGGDDNVVNIFSYSGSNSSNGLANPVCVFKEHRAAVKALSWNPSKSHILASGGGTRDKQLKIWDVGLESCMNTLAVDAQVTGLVWSKRHGDLVAGLGNPSNNLLMWRYPQMHLVAKLNGHSDRILQVVKSPCDEYVISAGADESIRLWHCFASDDVCHSNEKFLKDLEACTERMRFL
ncbi:Cell division cycle protein 20 -like protein, partial [Trichinella papuae]